MAPSSDGNLPHSGPNYAHDEGTKDTRESFNSGASPTPTSSGDSAIELPNEAVGSPTPASETSGPRLHNDLAAALAPNSSGELAEATPQNGAPAGPSPSTTTVSDSDDPGALPSSGNAHDKLLGGLLAAGFDEESCLSRYRSGFHRRSSPYKPSPYLVECLRGYEALHKKCGPGTDAYKKSLPLLKSGHGGARAQCRYLVWTPENGLGNRMISLASAFLYALLSDRVLLIDRSKDLGSLFCEPFPHSTWLLPLDFPLKASATFNQKHPQSFGNMLRNANISKPESMATSSASGPTPAFIYAHLSHDYDDKDKRFFCEPDQLILEKAPWMVLRSDQYFVPGLFLVPGFRRRLGRMFPQKEAVFHHLGRYLFHPSNAVWGLITRYYEANLAGARERLGIQIRLRYKKNPPVELVAHQILNCTWREKLLPDIWAAVAQTTEGVSSSKAVLLTSLQSGILGRLEDVYRRHPAAGGTTVTFHQPSHEERQQTGREEHDMKALAEMYLLSTTDELLTSVWSTFGYVAQGLGGLRPWILQGPVHWRVPEPACVRAVSMEPCFHYPPNYDCGAGGYMETRKVLPFTKKCRDRKGGLKLVDGKRRSN